MFLTGRLLAQTFGAKTQEVIGADRLLPTLDVKCKCMRLVVVLL